MNDNIEAITRSLAVMTELFQQQQQVLKSHQLAIQAILAFSPERQAILERHAELLRFHENTQGARLPDVLH